MAPSGVCSVTHPIQVAPTTPALIGSRTIGLRLRMLGGATLEGLSNDDRDVLDDRSQLLALLSIVAVGGVAGARRERVSGLLWSDVAESRARHSLNQALYFLRGLGFSESLIVGETILRLNEHVVAADVQEFRAATRSGDDEMAVALYEGPFLDGFRLRGAEGFERWLEVERSALARDFGRVLDRLARRRWADGDGPGAVEAWRRLCEHQPFDAQPTLRLMNALVECGDSVSAIRHAREFMTRIRTELGVEPDPSIEAFLGGCRT